MRSHLAAHLRTTNLLAPNAKTTAGHRDRLNWFGSAAARIGGKSRIRTRRHEWWDLLHWVQLIAVLLMTSFAFLETIAATSLTRLDRFSDRAIHVVNAAETTGTRLKGFPTAPELAAQVFDALNNRAGAGVFRAVECKRVSYAQPIVVTATENGGEHHVWFDPESGNAMIRSRPSANVRPRSWPPRGRIVLPDRPCDRLVSGVRELLAELGIQSESATLRKPPDLVFTFAAEGHHWRAAYNVQTGAISAQPAYDSDDW